MFPEYGIFIIMRFTLRVVPAVINYRFANYRVFLKAVI